MGQYIAKSIVSSRAHRVHSPAAAFTGPTEPNPPAFFLGAGAAADLAPPPTWPNPSLATPIPSLSTSALDFWRVCELEPEETGLTGVGEMMGVAALLLDSSTCSVSASGSYPSLAMRSASSLAFFSAASKSMVSPVTFFAPSLAVFFAPRTLALRGPEPPAAPDLRRAAEVVMRLAAGFGAAPSSVLERGEAERATSLALSPGALRNGEGVRPEGVPEREMGGVGRLMAGLSHDEKKSSSGSPAGVAEPSSAPSLMTTSSGCLWDHMLAPFFSVSFCSV